MSRPRPTLTSQAFEQALGLGRECGGQDDEVRLADDVRQLARGDRSFGAGEGRARTVDADDPRPERPEHLSQRRADPTGTHDQHGRRGEPSRRGEVASAHPRAPPRMPVEQPRGHQHQRERVLGGRCAVGSLRARPRSRGVDDAGGEELLDPGERQLHPARLRSRQRSAQPVGVGGVHPHDRVGGAGVGERTARIPHRRFDQRAWRQDGDARRLHGSDVYQARSDRCRLRGCAGTR